VHGSNTRQLPDQGGHHPASLVEALPIERCGRCGQAFGESSGTLWVECRMYLSDDFGVDFRSRPFPFGTGGPARRLDGRITNRPFVDPLFRLA
jgi:hypothetical protein